MLGDMIGGDIIGGDSIGGWIMLMPGRWEAAPFTSGRGRANDSPGCTTFGLGGNVLCRGGNEGVRGCGCTALGVDKLLACNATSRNVSAVDFLRLSAKSGRAGTESFCTTLSTDIRRSTVALLPLKP